MQGAALASSTVNSAAALAGLRPTELPAPPQLALRVMHACADPTADARGIAGLVKADSTLTAELLRIVNSAYFGFERKVASVTQAVSILGQRALRHYVLCVAVRDSLGEEAVHGNDVTPFWHASLCRAVAARGLADTVKADPDECFTVGLLHDIGLTAMFHARPDLAGHWDLLLRADPDTRLGLEREIFGLTHEQAGAMLAEAWGLPDRLAVAVGAHHGGVGVAADGGAALARVAHAADWMAAICARPAGRDDVRRTHAVIERETGLGIEHFEELLNTLPAAVSQAADAFGFDVPPGPRLDELRREANLVLIEENVGIQQLNWHLQRTLDERDALAGRLEREAESARIVQRSLFPAVCCAADEAPAPFSGLNRPARELSGDFYDHFELADGRSAFCLADVSGKGMDAAMLMAKASSLFHCLGKLVHDPSKLLALINAELLETSVRGMFVTMVAGVYDPGEGHVRLVNAGHPPALLVDRRGEVNVLPVQAPPLGIVAGQTYLAEDHEVRERTLYLFSDGLIEAPDSDGGRLGYAGLVEVLRGLSKVPRRERPARVMTTVGRTHDVSTDDFTLLVLEG
jgi:putative nucleotidyltransferase with HDIG domain